MGTEESKKIWEENAQFWDNAMGDESNEFHREVVRPKVTELLSPNPADYILDIACGNGNYSSYLAQRGASVVAFDYSKKMIELAKRRQSQYAKQIEFCVADATDKKGADTKKSNDGCYLTTACVESRGLPDDCGELETLRAFRDTYLASQPNGKEEIAAYYRMAPGIVSAINALENRDAIWDQVYAELVEPCVALIHNRQEDSAYRLYKEYSLMLQTRYGVN